MNNLILLLFITSITLFSCRRNKESVGPNIAIASPNFKLAGDSFKFNSLNSTKFLNSGKTWFKASFNERVNWQIKIKGTKSKAYKILSGTSNVLDQSTSLWTGTQSGIYFFIAGEKAIAELSVYGSNKKWYDTTTIISLRGKNDFGPNALIWWDMDDLIGVNKVSSSYSYFNNNPPFYVDALPDGKASWSDIALSALKDPVQLKYRSMEAKSTTPNSFWVGGFGEGSVPFPDKTHPAYGFPGASMSEVYLNFYIRRRNPTTPSMSISVQSISGKTLKSVKFNPFPPPGHMDSTFLPIFTTLSYTVNFPIGSSVDSKAGMPNDGYVNVGSGGGGGGGSEAWNSTLGTSLGADSQSVVSFPAYPNLVTHGVPEGWSLVSVRLDQMTPESGKPTFDPSKIAAISGSLATAELTGFDIDFIVFTKGAPFNVLMDQNP